MLVWMVEVSCWLILVRPRVLCCWLSWPITLVKQSGRMKLTYIIMVATCNLHVVFGHCTVKQTDENVLNSFVVFETCIVVYICNKNEQNAHFFSNYLIQLYCLDMFRTTSVHPQENLYMQFYGIFSCNRISSLVVFWICLITSCIN